MGLAGRPGGQGHVRLDIPALVIAAQPDRLEGVAIHGDAPAGDPASPRRGAQRERERLAVRIEEHRLARARGQRLREQRRRDVGRAQRLIGRVLGARIARLARGGAGPDRLLRGHLEPESLAVGHDFDGRDHRHRALQVQPSPASGDHPHAEGTALSRPPVVHVEVSGSAHGRPTLAVRVVRGQDLVEGRRPQRLERGGRRRRPRGGAGGGAQAQDWQHDPEGNASRRLAGGQHASTSSPPGPPRRPQVRAPMPNWVTTAATVSRCAVTTFVLTRPPPPEMASGTAS